MVDAHAQKFFNKEIFSVHHCLRMGAAQLLARLHNCQNQSTNGRVIKGGLQLWLPFLYIHLGCRDWRASACRVFESHNECD